MIVLLLIIAVLCVMLAIVVFIQRKSIADMGQRLEEANKELFESREAQAAANIRADYAEKRCDEIKVSSELMLKQNQQQQQQLLQQNESRFQLLAREVIEHQTSLFRERSESRLGELLDPLKSDIDKFRRDVTNFYSREAAERFSLQERIKDLIETNNNIGREAKELATALRGNSKIQGDWGEMVLENILENSGLRPGEEFCIQLQHDADGKPLRDDEGKGLRPDVVVKYPGGKAVVIDSKVSLTSFVDFVNAETAEERDRYGKLHVASVMKHVVELSQKSYQDYVGKEKLDFVMMFIPNEGAYSAAMSLEPSLWQKAYDKRVLIVSPTQLVASLKLVSQLWSHDRQTRNAIDIAERSGAMYDKFVGFVTDMEKIEKSLGQAQGAYNAAMNKLRDGTGSLISRAEKLRTLGIKTAKRLPGVNDDGQSDK